MVFRWGELHEGIDMVDQISIEGYAAVGSRRAVLNLWIEIIQIKLYSKPISAACVSCVKFPKCQSLLLSESPRYISYNAKATHTPMCKRQR